MNKRPIDKSKKSNIKCEHCLYADNDKKTYKRWCAVHRIEKNYWNRCKDFKWAESEE